MHLSTSAILKTPLLFLVSIACTLSSCKKDAPRPNKPDLLCAHAWRTTAHTITDTRDGITVVENRYAKYDACHRDNIMTFSVDNRNICNMGVARCTPGEAASYNGSWYLTKEGNILLMDNLFPMVEQGSQFGILDFELVDLTDSAMKLKWGYSYMLGPTTVSITEEYAFSAL